MAWMMDTISVQQGQTLLGVATGKPLSLGGSLGRATSTSRGVLHIALAALRESGVVPQGARAAVHGYGKVGRAAVRFLHDAGVIVTAVADRYGTVIDESGLDVTALELHVDRHGSVVDFPGGTTLDPEMALEQDVDLLVPAAVEGVITDANVRRVKAKVVVEGANGPTTPAADTVLRQAGTLVVPDILANAGGVIVSYFEWVQANQAYWWSESEVEARLAERMLAAWQHVFRHAQRLDVSLRVAATALAVERVAEAHRLRGLYP